MDLGMNKLTTYFKWLYRNSKGVRGALLVNVLLGGTAVLLNLGFIWICKYLVDIATGVKEGSITTIAIVMAVVMICRIAINAWNSRVESMTYARMNFIIRQRLYSNLLQSQWQGKEKMHSGDTLNRLFSDVDAITRVICQEFPSFLTTIIQLIAAIVFMCLMDWRLALILILIMPVFVFLSKVFFSKMRQLTRDIRESESRVQSHIQESLQHKPVIQSMEGEGMAEERLDDLQQTEYDQVLRRTRFNVISRSIVSVAFNAGYATAFIWSAHVCHGLHRPARGTGRCGERGTWRFHPPRWRGRHPHRRLEFPLSRWRIRCPEGFQFRFQAWQQDGHCRGDRCRKEYAHPVDAEPVEADCGPDLGL